MKTVLSTGSLRHLPLDSIFAIAAASGYEAVELLLGPDIEDISAPEALACARHHGLSIAAVHAPFPSASAFGGYAAIVAGAVELAHEVGAGLVSLHPPSPRPYGISELFFRWRLASRVRRIRGRTTLAVENMPRDLMQKPGSPASEGIDRAIALARSAGVKLTLDTTHLGTWGLSPSDAWVRAAPLVAHIHLSDYRDGTEHLLPGSGDLGIADFLSLLRRDGYAGLVAVEAGPHCFIGDDEAAVAAKLSAAREAVEKHLA